LALFRDPALGAGLAMSTLVSTVVMATLVVGPFYLSRALGLGAPGVGLALSAGPLVAALTGLPAGRLVDRFGAPPMTLAGLSAMAAGAALLAMMPASAGLAGYIAPIVVLTSGYALFQAANNTAIMTGIGPDRRGAVSGMLSLSRNLGLITGASAMGAVFAHASGAAGAAAAPPAAIAAGTRVTFAVAAALAVAALALAAGSRARARRAGAAGAVPEQAGG
jgi:MFS family permease